MHNLDPKEIQNFSKDSARWWDENGPFGVLHRLNPVRIGYIRDQITAHYNREKTDGFTPLNGLSVLDIGCGGGLVCESMARLGATVTGIDADAQAINVAQAHAGNMGLDITYKNATSDQVKQSHDVVLALEIIEHVPDPQGFVSDCLRLCKKDGRVIFSTLNKTMKSYALGIVAAEHLLGWVPRGTHDWQKFVKPSTLSAYIRQAGGTPHNVTGLIYNPFAKEFALSDTDLDVNYLLSATNK